MLVCDSVFVSMGSAKRLRNTALKVKNRDFMHLDRDYLDKSRYLRAWQHCLNIMAACTVSDLQVQSTNDSSVLSKCSMSKMGYFDDDFISCFVSKISRRAPLINRGYYIRARAMNTVVKDFLEMCEEVQQPPQIISLGAGFDSLYFRIARDTSCCSNNINFVEVDFPNVAKRKCSLILNNSNLFDRLQQTKSVFKHSSMSEYVVLTSKCYKLLGLDLSNLSVLERLLADDCGISFSSPTLLISECSITYMDEPRSSALIKWAGSNFKNSVFATYEQITPSDGFGLVMLQHFRKLGSPLCSIYKYPDLTSQRNRYLNLGWERCVAVDMNTFYTEVLHVSEFDRLQMLEPFDEFEEFQLKCGHYVLACASQGNVNAGLTLNKLPSHIPSQRGISSSFTLETFEKCGRVFRYGHCSLLLSGARCLTIGGFGQSSAGGHARLEEFCLTDFTNETDSVIIPSKDYFKGGRLHFSLSRVSDNSFLIFGGRTSPSSTCPDSILVTLTLKAGDIKADVPEVPVSKVELKDVELRWRHTASTVLVDGKPIIVVFGGLSGSGAPMGDCFFLDPADWSSKQVSVESVSSPNPCHSCASCSSGSDFIVTGGIGRDMQPLNSVYVLNCATESWSHTRIPGLLPRYSHTAHTWWNKLYLIGGVNTLPGFPPGVAVVDLSSHTCVEVPLPVMPSPFLLIKHSSILDEREKRIIILGGGGNCFSFGTHLNPSAFILRLDEGLQSDDRVLAGALWRRFFECNCDDACMLETLVHYVREQTLNLEKYSREDVLVKGNIKWTQLSI